MNRILAPQNIATAPFVDPQSGQLTFVGMKFVQALASAVAPSFDQVGNLQGNVGEDATVNAQGTLVGYLSNISATGKVMSSGLPAPTTSAPGAVLAVNPVAHEWISAIDGTGTPQLTQPAFPDIGGTLDPSQIPKPTNTTLGGVESNTVVAHEFLTAISNTGAPTLAQPAFGDISGTLTTAQLPASGLSVTIATAKLTVGGTNGSMTFTNGLLTAQVAAT